VDGFALRSLIFLFLNFLESAIGRTLLNLTHIREMYFNVFKKWTFKCDGRARGICESQLKMCVLNVDVQNLCYVYTNLFVQYQHLLLLVLFCVAYNFQFR